MRRPSIKPLAERNRVAVGIVGTLILAGLVTAAFSYDRLPFIKRTSDYSAYFAEAGGIKPGSQVRVSGVNVGQVSGAHLEGAKVRVDFTVRDGVELGDRTEAAIKTETVLGNKFLELTPRGDGHLTGPIPVERTTSPYDLPDALGDLTAVISGLDTTQLSSALTTLAETFKDTPPDLKMALQGVARFSDTLDKRDATLRRLLANANKVLGTPLHLASADIEIGALGADRHTIVPWSGAFTHAACRVTGRRTLNSPDGPIPYHIRARLRAAERADHGHCCCGCAGVAQPPATCRDLCHPGRLRLL